MSQCGKCFFWSFVEERGANVQIGAAKRGNCYGGPPTPFAAKTDQFGNVRAQGNLRAVVTENEKACGMFIDREHIAALERQQSSGGTEHG